MRAIAAIQQLAKYAILFNLFCSIGKSEHRYHMKVCPKCGRTYFNDALNFCRKDGSPLTSAGKSADESSAPVAGVEMISSSSALPLSTDKQGLTAEAPPAIEPQDTNGPTLLPLVDSANSSVETPVPEESLFTSDSDVVVAITDPFAQSEDSSTSSNEQTNQLANLESTFPPSARQAVTESDYAEESANVALLPFLNISGNPETGYICDVLTYELPIALTRIKGLAITARVSANSFRGKGIEAIDAGRTLKVAFVIEGRIHESENGFKVAMRLFDVLKGAELWNHEYERSVKDVFEIQNDISNAVASALKKEFNVEESATHSNKCRADRSGYEFFLKGLKHLDERGPEQWKKAVEYFKKAVEKSPDCAAAREGLASGMGLLSLNGIISPQESVPQWRDAASKALMLDSTNSEGHFNQANLSFYVDWKWEQAESEYLNAIKLNPSDAVAFQFYSLFLAARHRREEAIESIGYALRLDPLSTRIAVSAAVVFRLSQEFETSMAQVEKAIELDPEHYGAYFLLGSIHQARQQWEQAVDAYRKALELGGGQIVLSVLSTTYALMGKRDEASGLLTLLLGLGKYQYISAFNVARVYSALGNDDHAYEWLEKACEDGNAELVFFNAEQKLGNANMLGSSFNNDPRMVELLQRNGLL